MTTLQSLIISPILGALIGYFTNWLAIKMLFRPMEEKRLFGIKVPFTPGLIPKERKILTRKVAQTVGGKLLTKDVLVNELSSSKISIAIEKITDTFLQKALIEERNVRDIINLFLHDRSSNDQPTDITEYTSLDEEIAQKLRPIIDRYAEEFINGFDGWVDLLEKIMRQHFLSDGKKVGEVIPEQITDGAKKYLRSHLNQIIMFFINFWNETPSIDKQLSKQLGRVIEENLGRFIGFFLSTDKIYTNIKEELLIFIKSPDNQFAFMDKLEEIFTEWLDKETTQAYAQVQEILDHYKIEFNNSENLKELIYKFAKKMWFRFSDYLFLELSKWITKLLDTKINLIVAKIGEEKLLVCKEFAMKLTQKAIAKGALLIAENMDIKQMVEDKMNAFKMDEAEEIILSVVKRELNAITILGGVLGFIIGFVPAILNMV